MQICQHVRQLGVALDLEHDSPRRRLLLEQRRDFLDDSAHVDGTEIQLELERVGAGQIEDVIRQVEQMPAADANAFHLFTLALGERSIELHLQQLGVTEDRVQRRAHLVRHHGEKAVLRLRRVGQLGDCRLQLVAQLDELLIAPITE